MYMHFLQLTRSIVDGQRFDADPGPDQTDADPDPDPTPYSDADPFPDLYPTQNLSLDK